MPVGVTPNAGKVISLPFGAVDAVSGGFHANVPIGPRLPGRIPMGFQLSLDSQGLGGAMVNGFIAPVVWPRPNDPSYYLKITVLVNGEPLEFYPQAQGQVPQSAAYWQSLFSARGVQLQEPSSTSPYATVSSLFHCQAYPNSDGTKFLVPYSYTTTTRVNPPNGSTPTQTAPQEENGGFVLVDGDKAIWTQAIGAMGVTGGEPIPWAEELTSYPVSHVTDLWGDEVDITETDAQLQASGGTSWLPSSIVMTEKIGGVSTGASLSLNITPTSGAEVFINSEGIVMPDGRVVTTVNGCYSLATLTVSGTIPGVSLPTVTLNGSIWGWQEIDTSGNPAATLMSCPAAFQGDRGVAAPLWDWGFKPTSIVETASDSSTRTTTLTWDQETPTNPGHDFYLQSVTLPNGLVETLSYKGVGATLGTYSFGTCSGVWQGFSAVAPGMIDQPSGAQNAPTTYNAHLWMVYVPGPAVARGACIAHVTLADPNDPDPTHGETYVISSLIPAWSTQPASTSDFNEEYIITLTQGSHTTTILRYGTSAPTSQSPFRGTRLTHLSVSDMGTNLTGLPGYLFATSAIVQADEIVGTGAPTDLDAPNGWQPSSPTTVQTTVYDGFSLASWVNPSGALGTALPVTAVARRTTVYTPSSSLFPGGLPTKVTLAGDPGNAAASDAYGPIQTDEWTGSQKIVPAWTSVAGSSGSGGTLAASAVSASNSALSSGVHRQGVIQRHFDGNVSASATAGTGTMRLLTDNDQKTLDGGALPALRGVSSVNFGTTAYQYDTLGRVTQEQGTRNAFVATETRTFNGALPQIADTTKALTQNGTTLYANPSDTTVAVGTHSTFDATPYQWTKTITDKVDGRPSTILTRDGYGRVTAQTDVLGLETDTSYDPWGRVQTVTRQPHTNGASTVAGLTSTTTITADNRHKTETVTEGDTGRTLTTTTDFDAFGRKTHITFPDGRTQSYIYDGFGELMSQTPVLAPGETPYGYETWKYDPMGRVTDHLDPLGRTLMHVMQPPGWGSVTAGSTTVTGVITTTQDDRGYTRTEVNDLLGQKAAIVDQAGQLSTFTYDQDGHLIGTNQGGQTRSYTYNDMGWLTSRTEPEEGTTTFSGFTMQGTPLNSTQSGRSGASALTITTTLNHHLQPSQVSSSFGGQTVTRTLTYDDAGTHLLTLLSETQANGTLTESYPVATAYDGLYRLIAKGTSDGTQTFGVSQSLDAAGRVLALTYPSAAGRADQVVNTYDSLGRLATVKLNGEAQPSGSMVYDQMQQSGMAVVDTLTFGNGAWTSSAMVQGRLANVTHVAGTTVENDLVTWTPGGLMLSRGGDSWTYDALQRLSSASVVDPQDGSVVTQSFTYDPWGNRASISTAYPGAAPALREGLSWSATYADGRNSLPATVTAPSGSLATGVQYDDLGRMTQVYSVPGQTSTQMTWVYDAAGRVAKENGTSFLLDGGGLRFRRAHADGSVTYTVYGFHGEPLSVFSQAAPAATALTTTSTTKTTTVRTAMMPIGGGTPPPPATSITITSPASGVTVWTGAAIAFSTTTSPVNATVTWAFGDNATATGASVTHAYSAPGTYTVSGSAVAALRGTTTVTITVNVVAPPAIGSFTALPSTIPAGQSTTLSWNTTNTISVAINGAVQPANSTSLVVAPSATSVYTLMATNAGGSLTASLTVTVGQEVPASIQSFSASPSTGITAGSSATLSWTTTNATSLSIDNGVGPVTGTSVSVSPTVTTTYTLTARSAFGSATQQVTVPVTSTPTTAPVIGRFTASAGTIASGSSCDLAWQVSGASSVSLSNVGIVNGVGNQSVTPSGTTTYTLTASNAAGTTTKSVTVNVVTGAVLVWQRTMVYGFGQELREDQASGGTVFMQSDQVGSPNLMTDPDLMLVGRAKTLPFGEALYQSGDSSIRRYTNHEQSEGNAIYMQARMYLQAYGKFAETDPAYDQAKLDPESWNLYNYGTNNPVTHTDPDGRKKRAPGRFASTPDLDWQNWNDGFGQDMVLGDGSLFFDLSVSITAADSHAFSLDSNVSDGMFSYGMGLPYLQAAPAQTTTPSAETDAVSKNAITLAQTGVSKNAATLADAPALKPGAAPDQGAASNVGWSTKEDAITHGAAFIKKTYGKGDSGVNNYEYGFNVETSKGSDGKTVYKWGTIIRGPLKNGDSATLGVESIDFHTHTLQSPASREIIRTSWGGLSSSRDRLLPSGDDMMSVSPGRGQIYIGNSDSFRNNRIYAFSEQVIGGQIRTVSREVDLP